VDLLGVAQVVVEHKGYQRNRRATEPSEDALVLVGVDVETAELLVS